MTAGSAMSPAAPAVFRRVPREADVEAVRALVVATGRFSPEEVAIAAALVREALEAGPACDYRFLFLDARVEAGAAESGGARAALAGYACHGRIPATRESHDLYWIAVAPDRQRRGLGRQLLAEVEREVVRAGGRRLYVDTSGRDAYAPTRAFYERAGYVRDATLADFYAPGDAKVIFRKAL